MRIRDQEFGGVSVDETIARLVDEHERAALRARMRADAEHARNDAEDLAEVRRVMAEMDEISAW
jgi:hypothetical protein